ncbi:MAG: signal recognition particle-docking protein FtsY [Deltaproteobacteria bacterium]|nr:signal recognition particle-docking protein FtsY [Deltaproteobacteria bacterium]
MSTDNRSEAREGEKRSSKERKTEKTGVFGRLFGRRKKVSSVEADASAPVAPAEAVAVPEAAETPVTETSPVAPKPEAAAPIPEAPVAAAEDSPGTVGDEAGLESGKVPEAETSVQESEASETGKDEADKPDKPDKEEKRGLFSRLKQGLAKTRKQFVGTLDNLLYGDKEIDEEFLEELEEILLTSDLGVKTSYRLFSQVEEKVSHKELENPTHLRNFLQQEIGAILKQAEAPWEIDKKPYVIMTIGVNGVGKTTTIGKLAAIFTKQKKKVVLGAADTFRAAAVEQLTVWAERAGVPIIKQNMGADPAAVAFDTVQSAIKRDADIVIIDTAGRLHTKVNLMDELKKIQRVLDKALPGAPHEVLLVLDANTGQNAITQAQMFNEAIGVTGLVMTKLDGTAKGGVIVGVCDELKVPVRYIGIGESIRDLRSFDANDFVDALFDRK